MGIPQHPSGILSGAVIVGIHGMTGYRDTSTSNFIRHVKKKHKNLPHNTKQEEVAVKKLQRPL